MAAAQRDEADEVSRRYRESASFLDGLVPSSNERSRTPSASGRPRPHITLTFAQTVDGCIAGERGRQLILSGAESMAMTHCMRTLHDAILVGVGTVINDNPRLNSRLIPQAPPPHAQPLPIILDSSLRTPRDCKLITNAAAGLGRAPVTIVHLEKSESQAAGLRESWSQLQRDGIVRLVPASSMAWPDVLDALARLGDVGSVMVEGGARVIESLLTAERGSLVDALVVTVSPKLAGTGATKYRSPALGTSESANQAALAVVRRQWFGQDAVWMWKKAESGR